MLEISSQQVELFEQAAKDRQDRKGLEILVVEDQPFSNKLLVALLRRIGKTHSALTAQKGLELYLAHAPDVAYLDIEIPDVNGHELAAAIRQIDGDAYVVMVTANKYPEDVARAKQNGARGFVIKPYSKRKILENIEHYIHERKLKP